MPEKNRNYAWLAFNDPAFHRCCPEWEEVANTCVANLRLEAAQHPDDPRLTQLVGELSVRHDDFRRLWGTHHAPARRRGTKRMFHPAVGELVLCWDSYASAAEPDQQLVILTAEPGSASHAALRELSRWVAQQKAD